MEQTKKIVSVSDINAYLYCPRKLYLQRVKKIQVPPNRNLIIGKIKHSILENFSKKEENFISLIDKDYEAIDLVFMYEDFLKNIARSVFSENHRMIESYMVDKEDILKKTVRDFSEDIKLRIKSIKEAIGKGFLKNEIVKNLDSVYISELKLESENLGLRGRVDRILVSKKENTIIPFELKSREDKVFHSDELQLTAYAMLLEDYYNKPIPKGIVEVGNNKQELIITEENKKEVLSLAEEIRNMQKENSKIPPILSNFNKCKNCDFQEICMSL